MKNENIKKLKDMTEEERKEYNIKKSEERKTNDFFKETASKRVEKVIKSLEILGHMGKYTYTDAQKNKVFDAVDAAVSDMKKKFEGKKNKEDSFKFEQGKYPYSFSFLKGDKMKIRSSYVTDSFILDYIDEKLTVSRIRDKTIIFIINGKDLDDLHKFLNCIRNNPMNKVLSCGLDNHE